MIQIDVTIMGHAYTLACKESEEVMLREAVSHLNHKMCAIRDAGKIKGNDRIAVMAALGIAAELLSMKAPEGLLSDMMVVEVRQRISAMHAMLDGALASQENRS